MKTNSRRPGLDPGPSLACNGPGSEVGTAKLESTSTKSAARRPSGVLAKRSSLSHRSGGARRALPAQHKKQESSAKLDCPARAVWCAPWHSTGQTRSAGCQSALRSTPSRPLLGVAAAGSPPSIIAPDPGTVRYTGPSAPPDPLPFGGRSPKKPV